MYGPMLSIMLSCCGADQPVSTAWLWSAAIEDSCPAQPTMAWLWAEAIEKSEKDCHCGPDCKCGHGADCKCTQQECYEKLRLQAIREKKPLSVGVGCEPIHVEGILSCRYDKYPGVTSGIVVGFVVDGKLVAYDPIPCGATAAQIKAAAQFRNNAKVETLSVNH